MDGSGRLQSQASTLPVRPLSHSSSPYLRIILQWSKFELELSEDCSSDYVMIIEGNQDEKRNKSKSEDERQIERICGYFGENITL